MHLVAKAGPPHHPDELVKVYFTVTCDKPEIKLYYSKFKLNFFQVCIQRFFFSLEPRRRAARHFIKKAPPPKKIYYTPRGVGVYYNSHSHTYTVMTPFTTKEGSVLRTKPRRAAAPAYKEIKMMARTANHFYQPLAPCLGSHRG
jgi:hypothetical protein